MSEETSDTSASNEVESNEVGHNSCTLRTKTTTVDVMAAIKSIESKTIYLVGKKHTLTVATMKNGFTVVETSSCVNASEYDQALGEEINTRKIVSKVFFLLGYELQTQTFEAKDPLTKRDSIISVQNTLLSAVGSDSLTDKELMDAIEILSSIFGDSCESTYQDRARSEEERVSSDLAGLDSFINSDYFSDVTAVEQLRLVSQHKAMKTYVSILRVRIANFTVSQ
tara:strand:+ start:9637 stop:10311 length:675 start_codon:yes stop_codon:yes gene_type:complete